MKNSSTIQLLLVIYLSTVCAAHSDAFKLATTSTKPIATLEVPEGMTYNLSSRHSNEGILSFTIENETYSSSLASMDIAGNPPIVVGPATIKLDTSKAKANYLVFRTLGPKAGTDEAQAWNTAKEFVKQINFHDFTAAARLIDMPVQPSAEDLAEGTKFYFNWLKLKLQFALAARNFRTLSVDSNRIVVQCDVSGYFSGMKIESHPESLLLLRKRERWLLSPESQFFEIADAKNPKESHPMILGLGASVFASSPNIRHAKLAAQKNTCIANLRQIDGAKQQWAIDEKMRGTSVPKPNQLYGNHLYLKIEPACPLNGKYTIGAINQNPTCSLSENHGHKLGP